MRTRPLTLAAAGAAALVLAACGSTPSGAPGDDGYAAAAGGGASSAASPAAGTGVRAPGDGAYVTLAEYRDGKAAFDEGTVVYFFHATWCPTCRAVESTIGETGIPEGLTVVKVDFDTETDLRKEYGVTTQTTFVQVDGAGTELTKWTGTTSTDGAAILAETV